MRIIRYSVSQFLDGSSKLRAGCKKDVAHDAFDSIYVSCIHNSSRNFYVIFFTLVRQWSLLSALYRLRTEPAVLCTSALRERRWVGPRRSFSRWYLGLSVVAYIFAIHCCLFVGDIMLSFLSCPKYTNPTLLLGRDLSAVRNWSTLGSVR